MNADQKPQRHGGTEKSKRDFFSASLCLRGFSRAFQSAFICVHLRLILPFLDLPRRRGSLAGRMLKHTPFYDFHVSAGGRMVDFVGWEMPIMYKSIVAEHEQVRNSGGIFDVSHMGRLHFTGPDAQKFLESIVTRKIEDQKVGQSRYSLVCN